MRVLRLEVSASTRGFRISRGGLPALLVTTGLLAGCAASVAAERPADFPLHKVSDPTNRQSTVLRSVDDVVSSAGVHLRQFVRAEPGASKDETVPVADPVFSIDGINLRRGTRADHVS